MVIDSSALVAVVRGEPQCGDLLLAIRAAFPRIVSAPTAIEASIVMLSKFGEPGLADLEQLLEETRIEVAPLTSEHVAIAVDAFRRFGKGRHRAALNFGDCFSYALAKATGQALLFKGDDFAHTDVARAV
jgi:ribonuclease VapC